MIFSSKNCNFGSFPGPAQLFLTGTGNLSLILPWTVSAKQVSFPGHLVSSIYHLQKFPHMGDTKFSRRVGIVTVAPITKQTKTDREKQKRTTN